MDNFEMNFAAIAQFAQEHGHFPTKKENFDLYLFCIELRNEKKRHLLPADAEAQLNNIGFIWENHQSVWFEKAADVINFLTLNKRLPKTGKENSYHNWLQYQLKPSSQQNHSPEQKKEIEKNFLCLFLAVFY
jgi:hypothetical protein